MGGSLSVSCRSPAVVAATGKVLFSDGTSMEFDKPILVAELMLDHPQHFVFEFDRSLLLVGAASAAAGNKRMQLKPVPLPADKELEVSKVYFMLPVKRPGRLAVVLSSNKLSAGSFKRSHGTVNIMNGISGMRIFLEGPDHQNVGIPAAAATETLSRELSGRGWKPSLDTIVEVARPDQRIKQRHWLF